MEQCLDRIMALDLSSRRIVLARAAGIPWRRLEEMDGRSHTTLRKVEVSALLKLIAIEGAKTGADRGSDGGSGGGADRDNSQKE